MNFYAGIGSRETPREILEAMTGIARFLSTESYILRSGGAPGADTAFEAGAGDSKEIFVPWIGFAPGTVIVPDKRHDELVNKFHPAPHKLSSGGWKLMARNCCQILGEDLQTPVRFVICWTKDGKPSGGTGFAMRLAASRNIPIFNLNGGSSNLRTFLNGLKIIPW